MIFISQRIWVLPFVPTDVAQLFILGMVGYERLGVWRDITLARYVWRVLHHPVVLAYLQLCAPNGGVGVAQAPSVLVPSTNILKFSLLSRAIRIINVIHTKIYIYNCSLQKLKEITQCIISEINTN